LNLKENTMKKMMLAVCLCLVAATANAQEVDCEKTPYYGVCPVCEAVLEVDVVAEPEQSAAKVEDADCDMRPFVNGICQTG